MSFNPLQLAGRRISRRQFLKYSSAASATAWLASQGLIARAQGGGVLVWLGHQEVAGLGPNDIGPDVQSAVIYNVLDPLLNINAAAEAELVLASSAEIAPDGLTYTFQLHEGVLFHDGTELTADDVKYTYDYYSQAGQTIASRFINMREVEVVDRYTVRVHMNAVNAAFYPLAGAVPIVPAAYHASVGDEGFRAAPIGTGAFTVAEWRPAEYTELVAFPDHFRGPPGVERLRLEVVPEPSVRYIALLTGDAHATVWPLTAEDALDLAAQPGFVSFNTNSNSPRFIPLNVQVPVLSDRRVRQAMLSALDRQRIVDELEAGLGVVASSHLAPHNPYFTSEGVPQYPFDPERARSLLEEAGWTAGSDGIRVKDGQRLSFTCTTISGDQARRPMAELSQIFLRNVGVEMQLAEAPVASILEGLRLGNLEASLFNWTMGTLTDPSPTSVLTSNGGDNFSSFRNDEMDALILQGLSIADPEGRRPIYARTQQLYAEEVPALYLHYNQTVNIVSEEMLGLPENIVSSISLHHFGYRYSLRG